MSWRVVVKYEKSKGQALLSRVPRRKPKKNWWRTIMKFKEAVTYDDMLIVPQYSDITSRSEVDISSALRCDKKVTITDYCLSDGYCVGGGYEL
jgi:hypothetical protein